MEDLTYWRGVLDGLDSTLVCILVRREAVSRTLGEIKGVNNLDTHQPSREQEIVTRLALLYSELGGHHHEPLDYIARVYTSVFNQSREIQDEFSYQGCSKTQL